MPGAPCKELRAVGVALAGQAGGGKRVGIEVSLSSRCPLCGDRMAAGLTGTRPQGGEVEQQLVEIIAELYPHWRLEDGACPNCVDLFGAYRETFARPRRAWCWQPAPRGGSGATIPCSLCGYEILREDFLFHQRIEETIFDRIKNQRPAWKGNARRWPRSVADVAKVVAGFVDKDYAPNDDAA